MVTVFAELHRRSTDDSGDRKANLHPERFTGHELAVGYFTMEHEKDGTY